MSAPIEVLQIRKLDGKSTVKAAAPGYFGMHAARLAGLGYEPIPITLPCDGNPDAGKKPAMPKWTEGCPRERWAEFAGCGTGLLTRNLPTIDIDTLDQSIGDALQGLVDQHLGDAPIRYGHAPKRAMPFRLKGEQFGKLQLCWKPIPGTGDEGRIKDPGVEVLARNQQFVALGIHPGTRQPYHWKRDPDLNIPRGLLPGLDEATARRFMAVVARFVADIGGQITSGAALLEKPRLRVVRHIPDTPEGERIAAALDRMGNPNLHYDEWVRIGLAIKAALGSAGFGVWDNWSRKSAKYDQDTTERKWKSFRPHSIGAGSIFWLERGQ